MKKLCQVSKFLKLSSYLILLAILVISCECGSGHNSTQPQRQRSPQEKIDDSRSFLEQERESIEAYIDDRQLDMRRSGTGLYYQILQVGDTPDSIYSEDLVEFEYEIYLMNGTLLYSSDESGTRRLRIDKEDAVIGLHEALKLLRLGDKGRFILPSHLAHGVAGDQNRVPPMTPLVYELKIINIQKSKS